MAWGTYMLRKPFVPVFIRFRVRARHLEEAAVNISTKKTKKSALLPSHQMSKNYTDVKLEL